MKYTAKEYLDMMSRFFRTEQEKLLREQQKHLNQILHQIFESVGIMYIEWHEFIGGIEIERIYPDSMKAKALEILNHPIIFDVFGAGYHTIKSELFDVATIEE